MSMLSTTRAVALFAMALIVSVSMHGQEIPSDETKPGTVVGTVTDVAGDPVPQATVVLEAPENASRTLVTGDNGFFEFHDVKPGTAYQVHVTAQNFADWTSARITLEPGQFKIMTGVQLRIETERTSVDVHYDPVEVATEQFKAEEKQRLFGVIPNFYIAYDQDAEPLTAKMKFRLAFKISTDPVTAAGVLFVAGARQAANSPRYGQGWGTPGRSLRRWRV